MTRISLVCLGLGLLSGCAPDPFVAPGTWHATGVNDANLREMVANPNDLIAGQAASGAWAQEAATAVQRLVDDKTRSLTAVVTNTSGAGGGSAGATAQ